jgi:hypothetical protein
MVSEPASIDPPWSLSVYQSVTYGSRIAPGGLRAISELDDRMPTFGPNFLFADKNKAAGAANATRGV